MKKFMLSLVFTIMATSVLAATNAEDAGYSSAPCTAIIPYTGNTVLSGLAARETVYRLVQYAMVAPVARAYLHPPPSPLEYRMPGACTAIVPYSGSNEFTRGVATDWYSLCFKSAESYSRNDESLVGRDPTESDSLGAGINLPFWATIRPSPGNRDFNPLWIRPHSWILPEEIDQYRMRPAFSSVLSAMERARWEADLLGGTGNTVAMDRAQWEADLLGGTGNAQIAPLFE